jgi:hypothetical protein
LESEGTLAVQHAREAVSVHSLRGYFFEKRNFARQEGVVYHEE